MRSTILGMIMTLFIIVNSSSAGIAQDEMTKSLMFGNQLECVSSDGSDVYFAQQRSLLPHQFLICGSWSNRGLNDISESLAAIVDKHLESGQIRTGDIRRELIAVIKTAIDQIHDQNNSIIPHWNDTGRGVHWVSIANPRGDIARTAPYSAYVDTLVSMVQGSIALIRIIESSLNDKSLWRPEYAWWIPDLDYPYEPDGVYPLNGYGFNSNCPNYFPPAYCIGHEISLTNFNSGSINDFFSLDTSVSAFSAVELLEFVLDEMLWPKYAVAAAKNDGNIDAALEIVRQIESHPALVRAVLDLVSVKPKVPVDWCAEIQRLNVDPSRATYVLAAVIAQQVKIGDLEGAFKTATNVPCKSVFPMSVLAVALAEVDEVERALEVVSSMHDECAQIQCAGGDGIIEWAFSRIAIKQTEMGNVSGASYTIQMADQQVGNSDGWLDRARRHVALRQAHSRKARFAVETAQGITREYWRENVLNEIDRIFGYAAHSEVPNIDG